jgi:hypothetical protein
MTDLVHRLRERARIRRAIDTRKSVQEGKPDRIADLLDEAATEIERLESWRLGIERGATELDKLRIEIEDWKAAWREAVG